MMIATSIATWTGYKNIHHDEGYPWSSARQGQERPHKILGPYGNLHVCRASRRKRSPHKSFHSLHMEGLQAASIMNKNENKPPNRTEPTHTQSKQTHEAKANTTKWARSKRVESDKRCTRRVCAWIESGSYDIYFFLIHRCISTSQPSFSSSSSSPFSMGLYTETTSVFMRSIQPGLASTPFSR